MNLGLLGTALVLGIAAIGSGIGINIAGQASIGAWKKCYLNNKAAPFILTVFAGAPLTQTIYGFLLMLFKHSQDVAERRPQHPACDLDAIERKRYGLLRNFFLHRPFHPI